MFDCTTARYDDIYAPWLFDAGALLRLAKYKPGEERLIDLCGGTGAVTKAALQGPWLKTEPVPNQDITLVDLNPRLNWKWSGVRCIKGPAEKLDRLIPTSEHATFDLVVCRQSMAYLQPRETVFAVAKVLKPGGRFVFSTFVRPHRFNVKAKTYKDVRYAEGHVYLFGRVFHLQARLGWKPGLDLSVFHYHREDHLQDLLSTYFEVDSLQHGRAVRWICTRTNESIRGIR